MAPSRRWRKHESPAEQIYKLRSRHCTVQPCAGFLLPPFRILKISNPKSIHIPQLEPPQEVFKEMPAVPERGGKEAGRREAISLGVENGWCPCRPT